jgi:outer membrane protein insertion porin family
MITAALVYLLLVETGLDVGEVRLTGNVVIGTRELMTVIQTQPNSVYSAEVATSDERRLERRYKEHGYLQATVRHRRSLLGEHGNLRVTFLVEEGDATRVVSVDVLGNRSLSTKEARHAVKDLTGSPLNRKALAAAGRRLRALYVGTNHPYATVEHSARADTLAHEAHLVFLVDEGPVPVLTRVTVEGAHDVRPQVVVREVLLREGDPYDGRKLRLSRYRIHELGLFRSVVFVLPGMETAQESLQLVVRVAEASARWVEFGTGYGSPDRFRAAVGVGHDNVGGMARSVSLRGQASYGWEFERFVGRIEGSVRDPWAGGLPVAAGVEGFVEERRELGSRFRKFGGAMRIGRRWTERTESSVIYGYERRKTISLSADASEELKEEAGRQVTNSVAASQRFDLRDSPVEPSRGGLLTLTARRAGGMLGGDNHFHMLTTEIAWFRPLLRTWIGGARARLGLARPFGASSAVPFEERFRAGGAHTVRGYPEEGLGPVDTDGEPLGGEQIVLLSTETRFPLRGKLWGGVFVDGGGVWAHAGIASLKKLEWGAGVGLRYLTFIGPLRLDCAAPLPTGKGRLYVTLGHAF